MPPITNSPSDATLLRERHFDAAGVVCDYDGLGRSPEGERLATALLGLEAFDPRRASIPALAGFWLNVYNASSLAAALEAERGGDLHRIAGYFERGRVRVAGLAYSLDDIEHGLLRGNEPRHGSLRGPLGRDDPRLDFTPLIYDERMHFALYTACRSTPALRIYHAGRLEAELELATREYLRRTVRIEDEGAGGVGRSRPDCAGRAASEAGETLAVGAASKNGCAAASSRSQSKPATSCSTRWVGRIVRPSVSRRTKVVITYSARGSSPPCARRRSR